MTRVAAIDCGTNSIRLLIADRSVAGTLTDVLRRMEIVRLGQGVDRTGRLDPDALARTLAATREYADQCRTHGVEAVRFVATSATRDAANREEFFAGVRAALGVDVEVISGAEEAGLSFAGAVSILGAADPAPNLVVDIGGGSTELVLGDREVDHAISLDIGSVRMTERHIRSDPPTPAELAAARTDITAALDRAADQLDLNRVRTLVGVAGSVTTLTAFALGLDRYRPEQINGARLSVAEVHAAAEALLAMPRAERAALGFMHPGRVDVIGAGALIWAEVVDRVTQAVHDGGGHLDQVITSEHDILDGIALSV
ncbi:MAG TPA: Ppx/GppA family phosphatase [Candidatus Ruania gallistercoris]|uniref:Ppx/GppA family phosphatase n=1 Tax=Candidatus Ruania gallistercoris TaxID=2838746 RepID=A0A9D2EDS5_9MICO|nr:Ppx/GppA family phosphatase [Candidatus Ruania gallistercoris]